MGIGKKYSKSTFSISKSRYDYNKETNIQNINSYDSNPDPENYKIIKSTYVKNYLIILINYPDCTNYEGNKILLFKNCLLENLRKQKIIDPHFSNNKKYYSPIARFEPTDAGWEMAVNAAYYNN
jgi:hypothetical protein